MCLATQTILYYAVQYCTVLSCTVHYSIVLYCTVLYCTVQYYTVLYNTRDNSNYLCDQPLHMLAFTLCVFVCTISSPFVQPVNCKLVGGHHHSRVGDLPDEVGGETPVQAWPSLLFVDPM